MSLWFFQPSSGMLWPDLTISVSAIMWEFIHLCASNSYYLFSFLFWKKLYQTTMHLPYIGKRPEDAWAFSFVIFSEIGSIQVEININFRTKSQKAKQPWCTKWTYQINYHHCPMICTSCKMHKLWVFLSFSFIFDLLWS